MPPRDRSPAEMAEDLDEIKERLRSIEDRLDARYVPREVYEARHKSLRDEVALQLANIKNQQEADRAIAVSARTTAQWAFGVLATAVVVALVGFLLAGAGGAA